MTAIIENLIACAEHHEMLAKDPCAKLDAMSECLGDDYVCTDFEKEVEKVRLLNIKEHTQYARSIRDAIKELSN